MISLVALIEHGELRAPAPGWFHRLVEHDHLVAPGDVIGELEVLGRVSRVVAPRVQGLVKLEVRAVRRAVSYGELLFRVEGTAPPSGGAAGQGHAPAVEGTAPPSGGAAGQGHAPAVDADIALRGASAEVADPARTTAGLVFRAPTSGRFYGRSTPDKPAFVEAGSELTTGTTVCLLEVMKTFHRVTYGGGDVPARARVLEVLVADGADVNAGDPLLALAAL